MTDISVETWRTLLFPNGQDVSIHLTNLDRSRGEAAARRPRPRLGTAAFTPRVWEPDRLPSRMRMVNDLPSRMRGHLRELLDEHFPAEAAGTGFTILSETYTPRSELARLRVKCTRPFNFNYESGTNYISECLFEMVERVHYALTGTGLGFDAQERTRHSEVITDHVYRLGGQIKVLWEDKAPMVFNRFIGELEEQMIGRESVPGLQSGPSSVTFEGYKAIVSKLTFHATDVDPQVRWGVVFSAVNYMIFYMPRSESPELVTYCSPIMTFCLEPGDQGDHQTPLSSPQLWTLIIYMLLAEHLDIDDNVLKQKFRIPFPSGDAGPSSSNMGSRYDSQGRRHSERFGKARDADESPRYSGRLAKAPASMSVRCFDGTLVQLALVGTSRYERAEGHALIRLDRHLGAAWSSVYASSKSHILIKFHAISQDRDEYECRLINERSAYSRLRRIAGWVVPHLHGEYEWYGGRALLLSDGGLPLSSLTDFKSLWFIQRVILFCGLYSIHRCGVEHRDFAPRNVVQKWVICFKIIDFGSSNAEHVCPGWNAGCTELDLAWRALALDKVISCFQSWIPGVIMQVMQVFVRIVIRIFILLPIHV